jgi:F-type H+-transporting ATPase subunit epsilon
MEGKTLTLRLVSPTQTVFEGEVTSAIVPAWDGKVGILPGHAPFLSLLGGGTMDVGLPGGGTRQFFLVRGVVKVEEDRLSVLTEYAGTEPPEGYDPRQAWLHPDEFASASAGNPLV